MARRSLQQGFTLIELMIVIAIVGILASIAIPLYQEHIARAKVTEALQALSVARTAVAEYAVTNNKMPDNKEAAGLSRVSSTYVNGIDYAKGADASHGTIVVTLSDAVGPGIQDKTNQFSLAVAIDDKGQVSWKCQPGRDDKGANAAPLNYLPANCRG
ncbi:pilin [Crenobacter sp. SG2303]|uniref:Pilin n=1 Tax=Crenobacter oryzisoli TaxID=3056844 RepID=A0ABT7XPI2_9NEIS|nr:pilin [Crenobacter sp. SG2303]MDN0075708.1 pilin [Crenobacter sp. SG2303]